MVALYEQAKTETAASLMHGDDPKAPFRSRFQHMWSNWLEHRLTHYAQVVFLEQYYNSPWFSEESRNLSARLIKDWVDLIETGQGAADPERRADGAADQQLRRLRARDRQHAARGRIDPHRRANLAMAFGLCWDGIKA